MIEELSSPDNKGQKELNTQGLYEVCSLKHPGSVIVDIGRALCTLLGEGRDDMVCWLKVSDMFC